MCNRVQTTLSRNFPFERINSLQCYDMTRRCSPLLFTQISPLTYAVYLWPVHCECAMKHNRPRIFNYLHWPVISDFWLLSLKCFNSRRKDWQCSQYLTLNPTCATVIIGGNIYHNVKAFCQGHWSFWVVLNTTTKWIVIVVCLLVEKLYLQINRRWWHGD